MKRRGLAMGICQAGIGLGFMAGPPIIQYLMAEYAFSGTMLILGGVALHSLLGAALYQPIKWHVRKSRKNERAQEDSADNSEETHEAEGLRISTICGKDGINGEASVALLRNGRDSNAYWSPMTTTEKTGKECHRPAEEEEERNGWASNGQAEQLEGLLPKILPPHSDGLTDEQKNGLDPLKNKCLSYQRQSSSLVNFGNIVLIFDNALTEQAGKDAEMEVKEKPWVPPVEEKAKEIVVEAEVRSKKVGKTMGEKLRSAWERLVGKTAEAEESAATNTSRSLGVKSMFGCVVDFLDLRLLQDPSYVNLILGISVSNLSDTNFFLVLQFYLQKSLGFSNENVAVCLSVAAGADVASRLLLPLLGDRMHLRKRTAYLLSCLTSAIARSIFVLVHDFPSVVVFCGLVGFLKGTIVVNMPLTIAEHCRLEQFAAAYGLYMIINGLITITLGPLIGVLRDYSDSYELCIHILSGVLLLCAIPWLIEMAIVRWKQKRRAKRDLPIL
ncbi:hypothetical protein J437_LFUL016607 [Ladona fulva]|uniref:Uncharacterized protein n=1 Tax=Ladona fulva TaxID=123851 RepID=A0A8K0KV59_LADFU|nr:hypothetical protein J437_LFUL016607 [Ladona fulva]